VILNRNFITALIAHREAKDSNSKKRPVL